MFLNRTTNRDSQFRRSTTTDEDQVSKNISYLNIYPLDPQESGIRGDLPPPAFVDARILRPVGNF